MKKGLIILILIPLFFSACEKREWDNPYDASCNSETWAPKSLVISQQSADNVELEILCYYPLTGDYGIYDGLQIDRKIGKNNWEEKYDFISGQEIRDKVHSDNLYISYNYNSGCNYEIYWYDTIIKPVTKHFYRVSARAGNNISEYLFDSITTQVNCPEIALVSVESTTPTSITCACKILSNGGLEITLKGVCWNYSGNPIILNNYYVSSDSELDTYEIEITDLTPATQYYIRAYAYNDKCRNYSNEMSTTTKSTTPTVTTLEISDITRTSFNCGGNVITDGGVVVTSRGVCWNKTGNPTIDNDKTIDGNDIGEFNSDIQNLEMGTLYYVRAYATNQNGTSYGEIVSTSTNEASVPSLSFTIVTDVTANSAVVESELTDDGGCEVTEKGFYWNTTGNPTLDDNILINEDSNNYFSCDLISLQPFTTYYVRAFSSNSVGTAYSDEVNFITLNETGTFQDTRDGQTYKYVEIGNQTWMAENLNFSTTTSHCYDNNPSNCNTYGRLYTYTEAQNICPSGWHLPSDAEWKELEIYLGMTPSDADVWGQPRPSGEVGLKLKSNSGWYSSGNGNNMSSFTALPSGYREVSGGYHMIGEITYFWAYGDYSYKRGLYYDFSYPIRSGYTSGTEYSIRCVKD